MRIKFAFSALFQEELLSGNSSGCEKNKPSFVLSSRWRCAPHSAGPPKGDFEGLHNLPTGGLSFQSLELGPGSTLIHSPLLCNLTDIIQSPQAVNGS